MKRFISFFIVLILILGNISFAFAQSTSVTADLSESTFYSGIPAYVLVAHINFDEARPPQKLSLVFGTSLTDATKRFTVIEKSGSEIKKPVGINGPENFSLGGYVTSGAITYKPATPGSDYAREGSANAPAYLGPLVTGQIYKLGILSDGVLIAEKTLTAWPAIATNQSSTPVQVGNVSSPITALDVTFSKSLSLNDNLYYFGMTADDPLKMRMTDGSYNLRTIRAFNANENDIISDDFVNQIDEKIEMKYKKKGGGTYLATMNQALSVNSNVSRDDGSQYDGSFNFQRFDSPQYDEPGNYTVDAILDGKVIATFDVCLPTFTSSTGKSIGNETCGAAATSTTVAATTLNDPAATTTGDEDDPASTVTTRPTGPVNGACHQDTNNKTFTSIPTQNLCQVTSFPPVPVVTSTGWAWMCLGSGGGKPDHCKATQGTPTVNTAVLPGQGATDPAGNPVDPNQVAAGTNFNLLQNPFKTLDSFPKIIAAVINNIVLPIAVPFVAVMIMYSGFLFVVARKRGGISDYTKAKNTLKYTLIGAALMLGCFVIANALQGTLNSLLQ